MLALVGLAGASCGGVLLQREIAKNAAARMLPRFATCPDAQPVRLLIGQQCPGGVCGYSCAPDRWRVPPCQN